MNSDSRDFTRRYRRLLSVLFALVLMPRCFAEVLPERSGAPVWAGLAAANAHYASLAAAFQFRNADTLRAIEGGAHDTYSLTLTRDEVGAVRVEIAFDSTLVALNDSSTSPLILNFDPSHINIPRPIQITAVDDFAARGDNPVTLTHTAANADLGVFRIGEVNASVIDNDLRIYLTTPSYDGDLGGIAGADSICMSDGNKPAGGSGIFKALLVDGVNRRACLTANCSGGVAEHVDWVLRPNQVYTRADGVTNVLRTNEAGIHDFSGGDIMNDLMSSLHWYWTGLDPDWREYFDRCSNWTSDSGGQAGLVGATDVLDYRAIYDSLDNCDAPRRLACVEQ